MRPTDSIDVIGNYFLPGLAGRRPRAQVRRSSTATTSRTTESTTAATPSRASRLTAWPGRGAALPRLRQRVPAAQPQLLRAGQLHPEALTLNVGVRFDYQTDDAHPANVGATAVLRPGDLRRRVQRRHLHGRDVQPAAGADVPGRRAPATACKNFSPRLGFTYDLTGQRPERREVQLRPLRRPDRHRARCRARYNTVGSTMRPLSLGRPQRRQVHPGERNRADGRAAELTSGNYDYEQPDGDVDAGHDRSEHHDRHDRRVHRRLRQAARHRIRGQRQLHLAQVRELRAGRDTLNWTSANYTAGALTRRPATLPDGRALRDGHLLPADQPDSDRPTSTRTCRTTGAATRGSSSAPASGCRNSWMMNASYAYNNAPVHYDSAGRRTRIRPTSTSSTAASTRRSPRRAASATCSSTPSGSFRVSRRRTRPVLGHQRVAAFFNARSGYPFIANIQTPSRPNGAGIATVYLDKLGDNRLPTFQTLDFRVDKSFTLFKPREDRAGDGHLQPDERQHDAVDSSPRRRRATRTRSASILAPRVFRFGFRANW